MGNRSKYVAVTTVAAAAAVAGRRRARLRGAAAGIRESIMPTYPTEMTTTPVPGSDDAHAPGHQHLPPAPDDAAPVRLRSRPWTKHAHRIGHSYSGS